MASPAYAPRAIDDNTIKLEYGQPIELALKFADPKFVDGKYPDSHGHMQRAMITTTEGRRIWLDSEDARYLVQDLRDRGIRTGEPFRLTKIKMPHGGGHSLRVERIGETAGAARAGAAPSQRSTTPSEGNTTSQRSQPDHTAAPTPLEAQLAESLARAQRGERFVTPEAAKPLTPAVGKFSGVLAAALIASIDGYLLAAEYAKSKGLAVSWSIEFNAEDVRQSATSMMIESFRRESGYQGGAR